MATQLSCDCGNKLLVDAADRGKQVRCPACRASIHVPDDRGGKTAEPDDPLIVFECAECGNAMKARTSYAGRATRCPKCQAAVTIPGAGASSPPEKKSAVGRNVLIAVGLPLLAGGILLAVLFVPWGARKGGKDIDDLALVPADAQALVCVKVGALWETPAVRKMVADSRRDHPDVSDLGKQLEADLGLKPEEIERVTRVITNATKSEGWTVVKTKAPFDGKALNRRLHDARPMSHLDHPYFVGTDSQGRPTASAVVGPSVFVVGNEEGVRQALALIATPISTGPLATVVEMCRKPDNVVFGYDPAAGRLEGSKGGFDLRSLNDMELLFGTANVGEQVEATARARANTNERAESFRGTSAGLLRVAKTGYAFARFLPGEKGAQAAQMIKLLDAVKLRVEDKDVVATMKTDADLVLPLLLGATRLP